MGSGTSLDTQQVPGGPTYKLRSLCQYALKPGASALADRSRSWYMHRDLVERRQWIRGRVQAGLDAGATDARALAAQLAMYFGYVHYRVVGATVVGVAFVLPSFLMVVAIGWAYVRFGGLSWMQAVFYGVGAAVIGIIAISAYKLTTRTSAATGCCGRSSAERGGDGGHGGGKRLAVPGRGTSRLARPGAAQGVGRHVHSVRTDAGLPASRGRLEQAGQIGVFFAKAGCVRFRQRPGDSAVSLRRRGP